MTYHCHNHRYSTRRRDTERRFARGRRGSAAVIVLAAALTLIGSSSADAVTSGSAIWTAQFAGPLSGNLALATVVSPDGSRVFVAGYSPTAATGDDFETVAYDTATGYQLWASRYNGPANAQDDAYAMAISPDGTNVFVTGPSARPDGSWDYATVAYSAATGAQLWVRRYNGPGNSDDIPRSIVVMPGSQTVVMTGEAATANGTTDATTIAYDTTTGNTRWMARFNGRANTYDGGEAVGVSPDGSKVFVGGSEGTGPDTRIAVTIAYSAQTGQRIWTKRYTDSTSFPDDAITALVISRDGSTLYTTGFSDSDTTAGDFITIAYDSATGAKRWKKLFDRGVDGNDAPLGIAVSPDGSKLFVTGYGSGGNPSRADYETLAYDAASGAKLWRQSYDGSGHYNTGEAIAVSPDGKKVFVSGRSDGSTTANDATFAYDAATGSVLWSRINLNTEGLSEAVSPDGSKLFVTGFLYTTTGDDFETIAYAE
jgi:hypothetical protein